MLADSTDSQSSHQYGTCNSSHYRCMLHLYIILLTARPWAERGSCFTRDLFYFIINRAAMGRARFLFYTGFIIFFFVGDQTQTSTRPNRVWGFEITQPMMFIRQKLLKHQCTENVADIVFFIVYKVYFLLVLSKRWIQSEC